MNQPKCLILKQLGNNYQVIDDNEDGEPMELALGLKSVLTYLEYNAEIAPEMDRIWLLPITDRPHPPILIDLDLALHPDSAQIIQDMMEKQGVAA